MTIPHSFDLTSLSAAYESGATTPEKVIDSILARIDLEGLRPIWITLRSSAAIARSIAEARLRRAQGETLPLFGIPFAVKDNIDVEEMPTTAACPAFAYTPSHSAPVVARLMAAGAILVGKTNLDQFATGLVGARSPYGICASTFDPAYISGGSSSGSAVAVAAGLVSFALGTDTAGSGRVPAAFNNIVGLKPTRGLISTRGVVPACRSLDCVSIFAATADDALDVLDVAQGFDAEDPYSRPRPEGGAINAFRAAFRFGVPEAGLEFLGDRNAQRLYRAAVERLEALGGVPVGFDLAPFREAAALLYQGPWVAERLAALRSYGFDEWEAMDPTVRQIIQSSGRLSAADGFAAFHRLAELLRTTEPVWSEIDCLLLPTAPTIYRIAEVQANPVVLNSNLGLYTNFANLMDLAAIAVPVGLRDDGLPFGVSLIGRAFSDRALAAIGDRLHRWLPETTIGATGAPLPVPRPPRPASGGRIDLAVVGAHLSGMPLNWQLTDRGAKLLRTARTAPGYCLYALPGTTPPKPGLVFDGRGRGGIALEIWSLDAAAFGGFVAEIPPPLGIGTIALEDGGGVKGFLCEAHAIAGAEDITALGGWRAYMAARSGAKAA